MEFCRLAKTACYKLLYPGEICLIFQRLIVWYLWENSRLIQKTVFIELTKNFFIQVRYVWFLRNQMSDIFVKFQDFSKGISFNPPKASLSRRDTFDLSKINCLTCIYFSKMVQNRVFIEPTKNFFIQVRYVWFLRYQMSDIYVLFQDWSKIGFLLNPLKTALSMRDMFDFWEINCLVFWIDLYETQNN